MVGYEQGSIGWWMDERRAELGLSWPELAERAAVAPETLYKAARGRPMRTRNRQKVEDALGWARGSIDLIRDGGEPTEAEPEQPEIVDRDVDEAAHLEFMRENLTPAEFRIYLENLADERSRERDLRHRSA